MTIKGNRTHKLNRREYNIRKNYKQCGLIWEPTGSHTPRCFFLKKFKVNFSSSQSKSVELILKSFDDKYSLILLIFSYLFILSHFFIRSADLFYFISFYGMSYLKFLPSKDKIVVNFTNETLLKFRTLVDIPETTNPRATYYKHVLWQNF